jgi:hypothetical protein
MDGEFVKEGGHMGTAAQYTSIGGDALRSCQSTAGSGMLLATGKGLLALLAILAATYWLAPFEAELESTTPVAERALQ